jgi:cysteine desulfurase
MDHPSTTHYCENILTMQNDIEVDVIHPNAYGEITVDNVMESIDETTDVLSVIHANNETGIINNIKEISAKVKELNPKCVIHVDCVQSFSKLPLDFPHVDAITICMQKIGGPVGVSCLVVDKNVEFMFDCKGNIGN